MKLTLFLYDITKNNNLDENDFKILFNKLISIANNDESILGILSLIVNDNKVLNDYILTINKYIKPPLILGKCFLETNLIESYINELKCCYIINSIYYIDDNLLNSNKCLKKIKISTK